MRFCVGRVLVDVQKADDEKCLALSSIISRGWVSVFLFLYFFDIDIQWHARDWMLREPREDLHMPDGRKYIAHVKNPKYMNSKVYTFMFPNPR